MTDIIATRKARSSQEIMDLDQNLLLAPRHILHLYSWPTPTASYGCLVKPEEFLDTAKSQSLGLFLAKRPTGGGIIFHLTDLAFSFLLPSDSPHFSERTEENYLFVNGLVAKALEKHFPRKFSFLKEEAGASRFCMARATKYDIMVEGGKLVGAAQRRTKKGLLHQGSISICPPPPYIQECLHHNVYEEMKETSRFLFDKPLRAEKLAEVRSLIEESLIHVFAEQAALPGL